MVGIILASHGPLSRSIIQSAELICGKNIPQITALSLTGEMSIEEFRNELILAINKVDSGDGVLVLVDIPGGTPSNIALQQTINNKNLEVVSGFNLSMLLEIVMNRENKNLVELAQLACETGQKSIEILSKKLKNMAAM